MVALTAPSLRLSLPNPGNPRRHPLPSFPPPFTVIPAEAGIPGPALSPSPRRVGATLVVALTAPSLRLPLPIPGNPRRHPTPSFPPPFTVIPAEAGIHGPALSPSPPPCRGNPCGCPYRSIVTIALPIPGNPRRHPTPSFPPPFTVIPAEAGIHGPALSPSPRRVGATLVVALTAPSLRLSLPIPGNPRRHPTPSFPPPFTVIPAEAGIHGPALSPSPPPCRGNPCGCPYRSIVTIVPTHPWQPPPPPHTVIPATLHRHSRGGGNPRSHTLRPAVRRGNPCGCPTPTSHPPSQPASHCARPPHGLARTAASA